MKDDDRTKLRETRRRLSRARLTAARRGQAGLRRDLPPLRREAPEPTHLEWRFHELDPERLRTPSFRGLSPKGLDVVIHCRSCQWDSRPFPFDAIAFRATAHGHFTYIKALRVYSCRGGPFVTMG